MIVLMDGYVVGSMGRWEDSMFWFIYFSITNQYFSIMLRKWIMELK